MAKPTFLPSPLTIAVPASSNARRALISPATVSSPISPTRSRRQQTHRTRALRARPGGAFLRVPTEAALSAADYIEDMSRSPYGSGQATGRTTEGPLTADTMTGNTTTEDQGESPQLAADDIFELQEFLARKSWISDKISLYETMPDVNVFAGTSELASALNPGQPISGLPDRDQYQFWLREQNEIEREMEAFDTGDLNRLKKFAMEKSRQNLSTDDTDLVDLTLTTLLGLEKLASLLRRRSDCLEALRLRLLWEDQRMEAWRDRQEILTDLEVFVKRARWSPSTYDVYDMDPSTAGLPDTSRTTPPLSPAPAYERLRDTSASTVSVASVTIPQVLLPSRRTDFSRNHRFNLAESLSREAAGYASRVMNFKASRVTVAANTLEKLIAVSREKVPDEILGEQDRLEVKSSVLDGLGRFGMNIAMQWIKADQSYGDLKRVQAMAHYLQLEISEAKALHPTARMNETFQSRLAALNSRLASTAEPSSSRSFPRPLHPAYHDQHASNQYILSVLGHEVSKAKTMTADAAAGADEYQTLYKAVCHIDKLVDDMRIIAGRLTNASSRLSKGTISKDGDGTPIDISSEACLDPMRHMVYLASIPALTWELDEADEAAERAITGARGTLADLHEAGVKVDARLKISVDAAVVRLEAERLKSESILDEVSAKSEFLREARELYTTVQATSSTVARARDELAQAAETRRWQPIPAKADDEDEDEDDDFEIVQKPEDTPSTVVEVTPAELHRKVDEISSKVAGTLSPRQSQLLPALSPRLAEHISKAFDLLEQDIAVLREAIRVWEEIVRQAKIMGDVLQDATSLQDRVDEMKAKLASTRRAVSNDNVLMDGGALIAKETLISSQFVRLQDDITRFTQDLPSRIPLFTTNMDPNASRILSHTTPNPVKAAAAKIFSFSLADLDDGIKADANALASSLGRGMESMSTQLTHLRIIGYVLYTSSWIVPQRLLPYFRFKDCVLAISEGLLSTDYYRASAVSYVRSMKEAVLGDGGRSELEEFQHAARLQFASLSQDVAAIRREYEQEREERLRSQREFKKEIEGILEQLRLQQQSTMTPGRIDTARLEEIASSLGAFMNDTESAREEDRALERMRQVALGKLGTRSVTFNTQNPFL